MTVEQTIQCMYDYYPALFKNRADCLNQLFCTIGNGYEWVEGELVLTVENLFPKNPLKNGKAYQYNLLSLRDEHEYYLTRRNKYDVDSQFYEELQKYLNTIPDDIYHRLPRKERWYFYRAGVCKDFVYLFNYPEDIKADWRAAIDECRDMLIEDGYILDNGGK